MDESVLRQQLERFFAYAGADVDRAGELDHEDPCGSFRSALSASRIARQCGAPGLRRSPYANPSRSRRPGWPSHYGATG